MKVEAVEAVEAVEREGRWAKARAGVGRGGEEKVICRGRKIFGSFPNVCFLAERHTGSNSIFSVMSRFLFL